LTLVTALDGDKLQTEIGGTSLAGEITSDTKEAGIKDKDELADLIKSVKGAEVFMNKTPKDQLL
jgi:hypothetical protein